MNILNFFRLHRPQGLVPKTRYLSTHSLGHPSHPRHKMVRCSPRLKAIKDNELNTRMRTAIDLSKELLKRHNELNTSMRVAIDRSKELLNHPSLKKSVLKSPTALIAINNSGRTALFEHLFKHGGFMLRKCVCGFTQKTIIPACAKKWISLSVVCDHCATVTPVTFVAKF